MNLTDCEIKVMEATNEDPWGPSSTQLNEIARETFHFQQYGEVMGILWKRLSSDSRDWRIVYKALNVLEHLIRCGSDRVIQDTRDRIYELRTLTSFEYKDPEGVDRGINVRERTKKLIAFVNDDARIKEERQKATKNRGKYAGFARDDGTRSGGGLYDGFSSADYQAGYGGGGGYDDDHKGPIGGIEPSGSEAESSSESDESEEEESAYEEEIKAPPKVETTPAAPVQPSGSLFDVDFGFGGSPDVPPAPQMAAPTNESFPAFDDDFDPRSVQSRPVVADANAGWADFETAAPAPVATQPAPIATPASDPFEVSFDAPVAEAPPPQATKPGLDDLLASEPVEEVQPDLAPAPVETNPSDPWSRGANLLDFGGMSLEQKPKQTAAPVTIGQYTPAYPAMYGGGLRPQGNPMMPMGGNMPPAGRGMQPQGGFAQPQQPQYGQQQKPQADFGDLWS